MTQVPIRARTQLPETLRLGAILFCTCASAWLYVAMVGLIPTMTSAEPTCMSEVLGWVKPVSHDTLEAVREHTHGLWYPVAFMVCCAGLFGLYALVVRLAGGVPSRRFMALGIGAPVVFMAVLICSPVMLSSDTYAYAHYGRLLGVDGVDAHGPGAIAEAGTMKTIRFPWMGFMISSRRCMGRFGLSFPRAWCWRARPRGADGSAVPRAGSRGGSGLWRADLAHSQRTCARTRARGVRCFFYGIRLW